MPMPWARALPLLLLLAAPSLAAPDAGDHLEERTLANVLFVRAGDSTGSAFLLNHAGERYVVTARHVVAAALEDSEAGLEVRVGGKHGRLLRQVELLAESRRADLAVFTFEDDPLNPYFEEGAGLVPEDEIHLASQVFLVGYPASLRQTYGSTQLRVVGGWVAGVKKYVAGSTVEYVDIDMAGAEHGHSGGPILVLQDRVVAVAVQRRTGSVSEAIGAAYAVPIKYVTALIDGRPVPEDVAALDETLRGTTLICGLALHGKTDYDVWSQRIHLETGERVWGELGIYLASSVAQEAAFRTVPGSDGATFIVHTAHYEDSQDVDILVQKVSRFGELLLEGGLRSGVIANSDLPERAPAAVSDGLGGLVVAYEVHRQDGDVDVLGQRLDPEGRLLWTAGGIPLASATLSERRPALVEDGAGGAIVVAELVREDGNVDLVAQRVRPDGALAWHEGRQSTLLAASAEPETRPRVVSDGQGGAIVVYRIGQPDGRDRLGLQRLSHNGELLWGEGQGASGLPLLPADASADAVGALADGLGGVFVALETGVADPTTGDVDVAVQRVSAAGLPQWGQPAGPGRLAYVLAASSPFPERDPVLASDGQGGIVVVFEAGSAEGDLDVLAQRVDAEGRLRWNEGERSSPVALSFLTEHTPRVASRLADRILVLFEVEKENGRSTVACQALSLTTGRALFGGGRLPIPVTDPGDQEVQHVLQARDEALR